MAAVIYLMIGLESVISPNPRGDQLLLVPLLLGIVVVLIAGVWSSLALRVKRWHDRDKSWVWIFIGFIPFIGGLWELIELGFLDGSSADNRFGRSPKWSAGRARVHLTLTQPSRRIFNAPSIRRARVSGALAASIAITWRRWWL